MYEVIIPMNNRQVLSANYRMVGHEYGRKEYFITHQLAEWFQPYRDNGVSIDWEKHYDHFIGPGQIVQRLTGLKFQFGDRDLAMMFKLTWGGK